MKCDAGLTDIRLPALGGYIREVALLASVVAVCLRIRLLRRLSFVILHIVVGCYICSLSDCVISDRERTEVIAYVRYEV